MVQKILMIFADDDSDDGSYCVRDSDHADDSSVMIC